MVGLQIHFRADKIGMLVPLDSLGWKVAFSADFKKRIINAMKELEHREKAVSHRNYGIIPVKGLSHLWCLHQL